MSNVFRKEYRTLTELEKARIAAIKTSAEVLYSLLDSGPTPSSGVDPRAMSLARTKLEECVMWAVKGLT